MTIDFFFIAFIVMISLGFLIPLTCIIIRTPTERPRPRRRREYNRERNVIIQIYEIDVDIVNKNQISKTDCCSICLCEFNDNSENKVIKTKCNHLYHENCIKEWFISNNNYSLRCPLCLDELV